MRTVIINTVCTATMNETWVVQVADDLEFDDPLDLLGGAGPLSEKVTILSCTDTDVTDERDREVLDYTERTGE